MSTLRRHHFKDVGFTSAQFKPRVEKMPTKSIILAVLLLVVGIIIVLVSLRRVNMGTNHLDEWVHVLSGLLMLIPGVYYCRIALYSYINIHGYSYRMIPRIED